MVLSLLGKESKFRLTLAGQFGMGFDWLSLNKNSG